MRQFFALGVLASSYAQFKLDVEVDGVVAPVYFGRQDDLEAVARGWATEHHRSTEALRGAGCDSDECVVWRLAEAMRDRVGSAVLEGLEEKCGVNETRSALEELTEKTALMFEDVAGLCLYAGTILEEGRRREGALRKAVDAAAVALQMERHRAHAAKFGFMAALEIGDDAMGAFFGKELALIKRPVSGPSLVKAKDPGSKVRGAPGVNALNDAFEFDTAQYAGLHDASLEFHADQLRWLVERPDLARRFCSVDLETLQRAARGFDTLVQNTRDFRRRHHPSHHVPLTSLLDIETIDLTAARDLHGRAICIVDQDSPDGPTTLLAPTTVANATAEFQRRGVAVVDNFLTPETTATLRDFVLGSTIYTRTYIQGYLGAFLADGFGASPLIHRLAADIRDLFPDLLGPDASLRQAWAYCYARRDDHDPTTSHSRGIDAHADDADVSVNIWLTPDDANRARDNKLGGLVIYDRHPPADWDFSTANANSTAIYDLLHHDDPSAIVVPYKFNRLTLLDGFRFHKTDALDFDPGFTSHRINLTFLFRRSTRFFQ